MWPTWPARPWLPWIAQAGEHRAAAEACADDDHEERVELGGRERLGRHALPEERAAADRILAERGGLAVADVANGDRRVMELERLLEAAADGEVVPEIAVEIGRAEEDAIHGGRAGGGEADGGYIFDRGAKAGHRVEGGGDDRGDRAMGPFFGRGGKLIGDVNDFAAVVADRERAGSSADVDAKIVSQWRCLVWRRWGWPFCVRPVSGQLSRMWRRVCKDLNAEECSMHRARG